MNVRARGGMLQAELRGDGDADDRFFASEPGWRVESIGAVGQSGDGESLHVLVAEGTQTAPVVHRERVVTVNARLELTGVFDIPGAGTSRARLLRVVGDSVWFLALSGAEVFLHRYDLAASGRAVGG